MTSGALSGLVILITRPSNQSSVMQQALESQGAAVLSLPLIHIEALNDEQAMQVLKDKVLQLDNYHCLIFVSNNAVTFGGELINDYWPQFPVGVEVIAVGPTTAEAARTRFICEVSQPVTGMTSEDILRLPQLNDIEGKRIGIVRGQGGRELLADTLRSRGASVDYLEAYSRTPVAYDASEFCARLRSAGVNVLTASSGESLTRLSAMLSGEAELRRQLDLVVPSQRVAEQALEAGYEKVHCAGGADAASFVAALGELSSNQE